MAAYDISRAMMHFHKNNILYRDLKPENIGFDIRNDVKIFDLGLAKEIHEEERLPDGTYQLTGLTGSLRYMVSSLKPSFFFGLYLLAPFASVFVLFYYVLLCEIPNTPYYYFSRRQK